MVSFGGSEGDCDDSMCLVASDAEDWANSGDDSVHPATRETDSARFRQDSELILTKAVTELGLDWSALEETAPSDQPRSSQKSTKN